MKADQWLDQLTRQFQGTRRLGTEQDDPEGSRYIKMSDTYVNMICRDLTRIANALRGAGLTIEL